MTEIKPFQGLRYDEHKAGPLKTLVAPPYDVVSKNERDILVKNNPLNIFSVELPDIAQCHHGTDAYACADSIFSSWLKNGMVKRDSMPAFYAYDINFSTPSGSFLRRGIIALVRLADWKERSVLPHERTFDKVTQDRLRLVSATRTQFSPIFMLYRHDSTVSNVLTSGPADLLHEVEDSSGNIHRVSSITNREIVDTVNNVLSNSPLYIADGHHRYTTALSYRDKMRNKTGAGSDTLPFNYIMTYLVDAEDPGLIVLPTHRLVRHGGNMDYVSLLRRAEALFNIETVISGISDPEYVHEMLDKALESYSGRMAIGVMAGDSVMIWSLREDKRAIAYSEDVPEPLRQLDVVMLEDIIFRNLLEFDRSAKERKISFSADAVETIRNMDTGDMLFYMRPTQVHQVLDIADRDLTMPHKSTFFYPKILTGMVMNSVGDA